MIQKLYGFGWEQGELHLRILGDLSEIVEEYLIRNKDLHEEYLCKFVDHAGSIRYWVSRVVNYQFDDTWTDACNKLKEKLREMSRKLPFKGNPDYIDTHKLYDNVNRLINHMKNVMETKEPFIMHLKDEPQNDINDPDAQKAIEISKKYGFEPGYEKYQQKYQEAAEHNMKKYVKSKNLTDNTLPF